MIIVTTENVAGYRVVQTKGYVVGTAVRGVTGFLGSFGIETNGALRTLEETRDRVANRLATNAQAVGANGVIMMRFDSAEIGEDAIEIIAYGTAVVLEPVT